MIKQTKIVVDNVGRQTIGELNDYVKKLEQALNEIEKILNGVGEIACYSKSMCLYGEDIEDILEIIQKAKGDVKNENNNV
jgi:hypothetical protein